MLTATSSRLRHSEHGQNGKNSGESSEFREHHCLGFEMVTEMRWEDDLLR
jgi:hypothetical protein